MSESEALQWFKGFYNGDCEREDFEDTICADCNLPCRHGMPILRAISALEEVQQYRAIGTVSEFRELKEKATAKNPIPVDYGKYTESIQNAKLLRGAYWCPNCEHVVKSGDYCNDCGQHLDWSEGKE